MNKQNRNKLTDTENILMIASWEGVWGKELLQNSHEDVKYSIDNSH